jgi:hypothetical protein
MHRRLSLYPPSKQKLDNTKYCDLQNNPQFNIMLHPDRLHAIFTWLASLPPDACDSVSALYEALLYLSIELVPNVTWKVDYLLQSFLLPNFMARAHHTYAVRLILSNYRRLILLRSIPKKVAPICQKNYISPFVDHTLSGKEPTIRFDGPKNPTSKAA